MNRLKHIHTHRNAPSHHRWFVSSLFFSPGSVCFIIFVRFNSLFFKICMSKYSLFNNTGISLKEAGLRVEGRGGWGGGE